MSRRLSSCAGERTVNSLSVVLASRVVALHGLLVVDFTRNLPGPFAGRELLRLGARVVRVETPDGDPLRSAAPEWEAALNAPAWRKGQDTPAGLRFQTPTVP